MSRVLEVLVALDQLVNAVLGGYADETLSARCWRLQTFPPYSTLRPIIDRLFFWQNDHCRSSFESEQRRAQLPKEYRDAKSLSS
jgi:hypothetical protein